MSKGGKMTSPLLYATKYLGSCNKIKKIILKKKIHNGNGILMSNDTLKSYNPLNYKGCCGFPPKDGGHRTKVLESEDRSTPGQ